MTQYTSGDLYKLLSPLPLGTAVLVEYNGRRLVGVIGKKVDELVMFTWADGYDFFYQTEPCSKHKLTNFLLISAIKPEGFCHAPGEDSAFTVEGYMSLMREVNQSAAKRRHLITFPPPESPAQKALREAEESIRKAKSAPSPEQKQRWDLDPKSVFDYLDDALVSVKKARDSI